MVHPGDIVHWPEDAPADTPEGRRVVTDVTGDPDGTGQRWAVLRREADDAVDGAKSFEAVAAESLTVIGRLPDEGPGR